MILSSGFAETDVLVSKVIAGKRKADWETELEVPNFLRYLCYPQQLLSLQVEKETASYIMPVQNKSITSSDLVSTSSKAIDGKKVLCHFGYLIYYFMHFCLLIIQKQLAQTTSKVSKPIQGVKPISSFFGPKK